jgi:hypothetical protein
MFNFFKKDEEVQLRNSITFGLNTDTNEPFFKINILDTELKQAEYFGRLLSDITIGLYKHDIMKTMVDMSKQDVHINQFMQKTLLVWASYLDLGTNKKTRPIVPPSQFTKYSK